MTTPLFLLRCLQIGLSLRDLDLLTVGMVNDIFVEHMNDTSGHKCEMEKENSSYAETIYKLVNPDCCALDFEEFQELLNMHVAALVCRG